MKLPELTVIIPTLNNITGLTTLLNYFKVNLYPLIIIDNQPTEEKKLKIINLKLKVTYLPQTKNLGFAASINRGVEKAKTGWILILNDDIEFYDNKTIEILLYYAIKNRVVAVSPVLKNQNGAIENCGYIVLPYGKVQLVNSLTRKIDNKNIDGLSAACLLIRTDIFRKMSGFDESFFAYLEDVDLFLSLKEKGYKFGVCSETDVIHQHMTTSKKMGNIKQQKDLINWIKIIVKHPDIFQLSNPINALKILIERLRNISGYIKSFLT